MTQVSPGVNENVLRPLVCDEGNVALQSRVNLVIIEVSMNFRGLLVLAAAGACFAADTPNAQVIDQIVAKVNGDIVSQDELQRTVREMATEAKAQGETGAQIDQDMERRQKDILRDRIDELLLVQKAKTLNINVDSDVTKYMTNLQRQAGIADTDKFHDYVRQGTGMSYEDYLSETKNQMLTREVIGQEVGRHINISDAEVQDYYNKHKSDFVREEKVYLSEILISTEGKNAAGIAAAEKKAKQLADEAAKGERFSDLARDNSDATTAKTGGQLGAGYKKGDLAKPFEDAVWNLPKGAVTQPIRIPAGFEILKVEDHTKAGLQTLTDAKPEIENILYGPKMQPKVREYLTELRKQAFLQIKPGYVDSGAAPGQNTKWEDPAQLKPETVTKAEVEQKTRHKRLLWAIPIPGTSTTVEGKSSSR
jgi:peptidyl-prolyl cis-trans isomerase SurA